MYLPFCCTRQQFKFLKQFNEQIKNLLDVCTKIRKFRFHLPLGVSILPISIALICSYFFSDMYFIFRKLVLLYPYLKKDLTQIFYYSMPENFLPFIFKKFGQFDIKFQFNYKDKIHLSKKIQKSLSVQKKYLSLI